MTHSALRTTHSALAALHHSITPLLPTNPLIHQSNNPTRSASLHHSISASTPHSALPTPHSSEPLGILRSAPRPHRRPCRLAQSNGRSVPRVQHPLPPNHYPARRVGPLSSPMRLRPPRQNSARWKTPCPLHLRLARLPAFPSHTGRHYRPRSQLVHARSRHLQGLWFHQQSH